MKDRQVGLVFLFILVIQLDKAIIITNNIGKISL